MVLLSKQQQATQVARLALVRGDLALAFGVALTRWLADPVLCLLGRPLVTYGHRAQAEQDALYAQGRQPLAEVNRLRKLAGLVPFDGTKPAAVAEAGRVVTWVTASRHTELPAGALDVGMLQADGAVTWPAEALTKFSRLMLAADVRIRWGGVWKSPDMPHFEIPK